MPDVNMPKLSDTMEEGTVLEWKKQDGDEVSKGDVLAEIESDKASFEIEAESDGVLHIVVDKGSPVPVGQQIATIGGEAPARKETAPKAEDAGPRAEEGGQGDDGGQGERPAAAEPGPGGAEGPAEEPAASADEEPAAEAPRQTAEAEEEEPEERPAATEAERKSQANGVKASPLARRLAREAGVDLSTLTGSGPEGRIVKEDVLAAAEESGGGRQAEGPAPRPRRRAGQDVEVEEPNRMQATIARRMTTSKTTVPHFYVTVEARVDEAVRMRQQLKEMVPNADRVTMTDMLTRACAIALTRFPEVNASWVDGHFERKRSVNIGLAVPPAQGLGLLVPVVHDVDQKDLVQISIESRQVIERARSGKPSAGDLEGGTFSISNLGMYGVDEFSAIINPPESAILAVGAIKEVPVVENGRLVPGKVMRMTLSVDHRVFYGATAAQFMTEVKKLVESPVSLIVPPDA
ncbi:MAG: dihydrolipoamide acyltransferase [Candidatus Nephthysia bennettiae]|uniref:Dihydrolipoamide acetyltransferase component of pyruvate dehydrogenase complex n=1 Tax=Candidatus Nephthysia bennettiae TaxID=3127016 RepID=A0A934KAX4_9BACT|nr:2-oxo acid dehydrogenase subunit E2 [Candidatus Dormibacteraeota bacterium]MBJ7611268.1 2-oxo acid dehydrogenase subunit E2 [Candidatus Dormibacteraeota bacterium]PZR86269.1 MAG: dihydrolipoamide acyltransferase [Candidatus Dormibacteraeota bacterium]